MSLVIAGLGYKLFSTYAEKLPFVSNEHTAWASFGSLLSGFFTLTGTVATIATLLFLARQNKSMQKVTQAQLDTMTFERYISHRKLFIDLLTELEMNCGKVFKFRDPTLLYNSVFPNNSLHHCELSVEPTYDENGDGTNHLGKMYAKFSKVKSLFDLPTFPNQKGHELIKELIDLRYEMLMIAQTSPSREGDVTLHGQEQGFNIFHLERFMQNAVKIGNMIFRFTKNPDLDIREFKIDSAIHRDYFIKAFYVEQQKSDLTIVKQNKFLSDLAWVRESVAALKEGDEIMFPDARKHLDFKFGSFSRLEELVDRVILLGLVNICLTDIKSKYDKMSGGEHFKTVGEIHTKLFNVKNKLSSGK